MYIIVQGSGEATQNMSRVHEQQPCVVCAAGWLTFTESLGGAPDAAFSACESIKRVLIFLQ